MVRMSPSIIAMLVGSIVVQLLGVSLLPRTAGLTNIPVTILCAACFTIGIGALALVTHRGVPLGIMMPIMAASIPLITIFIGIFFYGESASPLKLALLVGACLAVGWAATL